MSLWNPYVFTPTGSPVAQTASPALRIIEGEATADQLAAAQQVFYKFCMHTRLSAVPNPNEIGYLPDGSRYRITDIAGVRTMELWLEDDTRSGIVIAFSGLDGSLLEGHVTDGASTTYLLTPKVKKGTRKATGKWRVRKLSDPKGGGKAVNTDVTGRIYFVGYQGRADEGYPTFRGRYGSVNEYAYAIEDMLPNSVFRHGSVVGATQLTTSDVPVSPVPFVLRDDLGGNYAAQLVLRQQSVGPPPQVDLLVGPISTEPNQPVGEVVATVTLPANTTINAWSVSFRPDGREARATCQRDGKTCKLTFDIAPSALSFVLSGCVPMSAGTIEDYEAPSGRISDVWTYGDTWNRRAYSHEDNFNTTEERYVNGVPTIVNVPQFGRLGTGKRTSMGILGHIYAFGPTGQEVDFIADGSKEIQESRSEYLNNIDFLADWGGAQSFTRETTRVKESIFYKISRVGINSELADFIGPDAKGFVEHEEIGSFDMTTTATRIDFEEFQMAYSGGGGGTLTTRGRSGVSEIYFNRYLQFAIYTDGVAETSTTPWQIIPENGLARVWGQTTKTPPTLTLIVKCRGVVVMSESFDPENMPYFTAYSAADPKTGAILVNLQQLPALQNNSREVVNSWLFAVDELGAKRVQQFMPTVPATARAKENRLLYSL